MSDSVVMEGQTNVSASEVEVHYLDTSTSYFDSHLPRQIFGANTIRLYRVAKRINNTYRSNFDFVKSAKVINVGFRSYVPNKSLNIENLFVKSVYWLISLGKLVI